MHIRTEKDGARIMTEPILCPNYGDLRHGRLGFERLSDYEYKCMACGKVISITRHPIVILEDSGRLKVQVVVEQKD